MDALASGADEGRGSLRYASGSRQPDFDPGISEWGNLAPFMGCRRLLNEIGRLVGTRGSETSQYPQEEKTNSDSVSSGERKRMRLNRVCVIAGGRCASGVVGPSGLVR